MIISNISLKKLLAFQVITALKEHNFLHSIHVQMGLTITSPKAQVQQLASSVTQATIVPLVALLPLLDLVQEGGTVPWGHGHPTLKSAVLTQTHPAVAQLKVLVGNVRQALFVQRAPVLLFHAHLVTIARLMD